MRTLYLTEYFETPAGGGLMRTWEIAKALTESGHEVHVTVPGAHHMTGAMPSELRRRFTLRYTADGIRVTKVWVWSSFRRGVLDRILYYFTSSVCVFIACLHERPDVVLASTPPFFLAPAAYILARLRGVPFVLEVRDAWLEFAIARGLVPGFARPILRAQQRWLLRRAHRIVAVTPGIRDIVINSLPENSRSKVLLVMNGYEEDVFQSGESAAARELVGRLGLNDKFVAIYAGTMGMARDCMTFVRAAARLRSSPGIVFVFLGEGERRQEMQAYVAHEGLTNCVFVPMQPRKDVPTWLAASKVGLNSIKAGEALESSLSNKIFDYLGAGLPVVWSGAGDTTDFVHESGGGIAVAPEDDEAMAAAILHLHDNPDERAEMGRRGKAFVIENFSRRNLVRPLEAMLSALAPRSEEVSTGQEVGG